MQIYPKMDWLTLTRSYEDLRIRPPENDKQADVAMSRILRAHTPLEINAVQQIKRNEPHYHFFYTFSQGWQLSLSSRQLQGVRIVASGSVLPVGQSEQRLIYEGFRDRNWRVTRCDVAIDVIDGRQSIEQQWYDGLAEQSFKRVYKTDLILTPNGDTIAVGSRKSDKYLKIYDKGKEQKVDRDWIRYELETKYKTAHHLSGVYNNVIRSAVATMRGMLDYVPSAIDDGFSAIAQDAEVFKKPAPKTRGNRELWLMTQVIPALSRTAKEDRALFDRFVEELLSVVK